MKHLNHFYLFLHPFIISLLSYDPAFTLNYWRLGLFFVPLIKTADNTGCPTCQPQGQIDHFPSSSPESINHPLCRSVMFYFMSCGPDGPKGGNPFPCVRPSPPPPKAKPGFKGSEPCLRANQPGLRASQLASYICRLGHTDHRRTNGWTDDGNLAF